MADAQLKNKQSTPVSGDWLDTNPLWKGRDNDEQDNIRAEQLFSSLRKYSLKDVARLLNTAKHYRHRV